MEWLKSIEKLSFIQTDFFLDNLKALFSNKFSENIKQINISTFNEMDLIENVFSFNYEKTFELKKLKINFLNLKRKF